MTEQSEQHTEVREIRIGFTLIDIVCMLTYIGLAVSMFVLFGMAGGLLTVAAGVVTAYPAYCVTRRAIGHEAFRVLNTLAEQTRALLTQAAKENAELKRQVQDATKAN